jgi:hypothetical protein
MEMPVGASGASGLGSKQIDPEDYDELLSVAAAQRKKKK